MSDTTCKDIQPEKDDIHQKAKSDSESENEEFEDAIEDLNELISKTHVNEGLGAADCTGLGDDAEPFTKSVEDLDITKKAAEVVDDIVKDSYIENDVSNQSQHPDTAKDTEQDSESSSSSEFDGENETDEDKCIRNSLETNNLEHVEGEPDVNLPDQNEEEDEDEKNANKWDDGIDEEGMKELEAQMTDEEKQEKKDEAQKLKKEGNDLFKDSLFEAALSSYTAALRICPLCFVKERSIMYSNRGACKYRLESYAASAEDCSKALELNPAYLKALLRRAECYEKTDKLDEALADYQKVVEMDPSQVAAREACMRLPDQIKERNEKMKEEMLSKLKDLGNMVLRPFGLSTDNFNLVQDPNTGGYSINFSQAPPKK